MNNKRKKENTNGVHAYNPCSQEDEAGGLRAQVQLRLYREFKVSLGSIVSPCLKINK
jgi:hypothetical protein